MSSLPPLLDVRDDLRTARRESDADVNDDVDAVIERLEEVPERDPGGQDAMIDEIDNELLRLEEQLDGDPARRIGAARNRLRIYRHAMGESSEHLAVIDTEFQSGDARPGAVPADVRNEEATVEATVLNEAAPREVVPVVRFLDDGDELKSVTGSPVELGENDQRTVSVTAMVPEGADGYTVTVVDAEDAPTA
ncbi:hypothetical protein G9464_19570 [Halostella sp. JP-L12]|uniref:DUF7553 family protein n=1 Tax=Halostella TaxID=1843185 RepID=UPI0013CEF287|nr:MULTISPECIES: hypothetical protein [Halostella]NHN49772.1 hypothetical protein [Halostella sp. JP-L12]